MDAFPVNLCHYSFWSCVSRTDLACGLAVRCVRTHLLFGLHGQVIPCKPSQYCARSSSVPEGLFSVRAHASSCQRLLKLQLFCVDFNTDRSRRCCSDRNTDRNPRCKLLNKLIFAFFLSFRGKFSGHIDFPPPFYHLCPFLGINSDAISHVLPFQIIEPF